MAISRFNSSNVSAGIRKFDSAKDPSVLTPTNISASGGFIETIGGYRYHTFFDTGSINFTVGSGSGSAEYLIVAGGGGGASGGGGAGGLLTGTVSLSAQTYGIVVGEGGRGHFCANGSVVGANGTNSSAFGFTAIGGGGGAAIGDVGNPTGLGAGRGVNGGSGGGAGAFNSSGTSGGNGTSGQGNNGGSQPGGNSPFPGGGGGGAGSVGGNALNSTTPGVGGSGIKVFGNWYAAGGAGGLYGAIPSPRIRGGSGIGGDGNYNNTGFQGGASSGYNGTGSGGGGTYNGGHGGAGGTGVVIVRYAI
jgi:hypothetical protein